MSQHSTTKSTSSALSMPGYDAARSALGLLQREDRGRILVAGSDRASYLQGLLTNDIAALKAGDGCYAAYLTAQGRMITDLHVYELGEVLLLTMPASTRETLLAKLDQFVFAEDVQLADVSETLAAVALVGPDAAAALAAIVEGADRAAIAGLSPNGNLRATFAGEPAFVLSMDDAGVHGYEVVVGAAVRDAFERACRDAGASPVPSAAAEALRIEAGIPQFSRDMDHETIPLEAGIEPRAISLTKGCYVGQEVIIRVLHRGHGRVARRLVGLVFDAGDPPGAGLAVTHDGREIGRVTSATWSPALGAPIALAYVHRDFTAIGTVVAVGEVSGSVHALPFTTSAG